MVLKIPGKFLTERYEKDEKYFRVYTHYRPDYKKTEITRKFYSKYEKPDFDQADPELVRKIILVKDKGPKERSDWPETTNQEYGWFLTPLAEIDRNDRRFYHPNVVSEITKFKSFVKGSK